MSMGGGGGMWVNCLLGMKIGVVLLSLLMGSFPVLLLAWVLRAIFCLRCSVGCWVVKFSSLVIRVG